MLKINIFFCGLAKNCEKDIKRNLNYLKKTLNTHSQEFNNFFFIYENDSKDNTNQVISNVIQESPTFHFFSEKNIDKKYPERIERLSYCRNFLLNKIKHFINAENTQGPILYVPIDLDSDISFTINFDIFYQECKTLLAKNFTAFFPISTPFYYDIYALRAENWVEDCHLHSISMERKKIGLFKAKKKFKYDAQYSYIKLTQEPYISVKSAFGGFGIYNFLKIKDATYSHLDDKKRIICEHVQFNSYLTELFINTKLIIKAPKEFISYNLSSYLSKSLYRIFFYVHDIYQVLFK